MSLSHLLLAGDCLHYGTIARKAVSPERGTLTDGGRYASKNEIVESLIFHTLGFYVETP